MRMESLGWEEEFISASEAMMQEYLCYGVNAHIIGLHTALILSFSIMCALLCIHQSHCYHRWAGNLDCTHPKCSECNVIIGKFSIWY